MYTDEIIKHHLQFASEHTKEMVQQLIDERDALKEKLELSMESCVDLDAENDSLREITIAVSNGNFNWQANVIKKASHYMKVYMPTYQPEPPTKE